ncbi:MAG: rRNA maturation RNase YbeY [Verrucomicrobiota bacterium]|jgi:rRNA maturation RNase YbeY|nr:rRNA maturation RNase YbeY [Verrucomicrobiota bacterium]
MRVSVCSRQRVRKVDALTVKCWVRAFAEWAQARRTGGGAPWREVTVHLLDDAAIAPVNRAILAHEGATDVITQRYEPIPGEPAGLVGELFVNVECACRAAPRRAGWSADHELALYLAHGCDHLSGADDGTPRERAAMRRRELAWLRRLSLTPLFQSGKLVSGLLRKGAFS